MTDTQKRQLLIATSIISAIMLVGALGEWPYGYFVLLRWVVAAAAITVAIFAYQWKHLWAVAVFGLLALLFNPLAPIYLSRDTWLPIDIGAAALFGMAVLFLPGKGSE